MTNNNAALASATNALFNTIGLLRPTEWPAPIFDPFIEDQLFNLATRTGGQAYTNISAPLNDEDIWDSSVATFPSFVVALRLQVEEGKCNAAAPHGILTIDARNIVSDYHSITDAQINTVRINRVNNRAIQNASVIFKCINTSIKGSIRDTIFTQSGNMPTHADGITLLKNLHLSPPWHRCNYHFYCSILFLNPPPSITPLTLPQLTPSWWIYSF